MTKNLDVTHYRNGDSIPHVTDRNVWDTLTIGAWCYYNNDSDNGDLESNSNFGDSGFQGFPGGYRNPNGNFHDVGYFANWWSASSSSSATAWYRVLSFNSSEVLRYYSSKEGGFSCSIWQTESES